MTTLAPSATSQKTYRLNFGGVLRSERIKLTSLRSIRMTLALTLAMGLGLSLLIAWGWSTDLGDTSAETLQQYLISAGSFSAPFLALIFGVLGVFVMASEYSSGMILSTLAAVPKRTPVIVAKAIIAAVIAALTALVLYAGALVIAVLFVPAAAAQVFTMPVLSSGFGMVSYLTLFTLFALGVAGVLRSTAGGIAVTTAIAFVLPIALQVLSLSGWEWVPVVARYVPDALGSVLGAGFAPAYPTPDAPTFGIALALMAAWSLATLIPAAVLLRVRDARA